MARAKADEFFNVRLQALGLWLGLGVAGAAATEAKGTARPIAMMLAQTISLFTMFPRPSCLQIPTITALKRQGG